MTKEKVSLEMPKYFHVLKNIFYCKLFLELQSLHSFYRAVSIAYIISWKVEFICLSDTKEDDKHHDS